MILSDDVAIINQDLRSIVKSNSWLTSSGLLMGRVYHLYLYDNRKYNVKSFIGHSVGLQYVIFIE